MKNKKEVLFLYVPKNLKIFLDKDRKQNKTTRSTYISNLLLQQKLSKAANEHLIGKK